MPQPGDSHVCPTLSSAPSLYKVGPLPAQTLGRWLLGIPLSDPNTDPVGCPIRPRSYEPPLHLRWCMSTVPMDTTLVVRPGICPLGGTSGPSPPGGPTGLVLPDGLGEGTVAGPARVAHSAPRVVSCLLSLQRLLRVAQRPGHLGCTPQWPFARVQPTSLSRTRRPQGVP